MVDPMIRLYSSTETSFVTNGLGVLVDAISCTVTEERNGSYELVLQYPITGRHFSEIDYRSLIFCKPNPFEDPQPFRVYNISKPINGVVTFDAHHISYDLSGEPVEPFTAAGISKAMTALKDYALHDHPFTFWTNLTGSTKITVEEPKSIRAVLGDGDGCILNIFNGEYKFDCYDVQLHRSRGVDRGFTIRYGKNLTDLTQDENCERVYTGIYPYWKNSDGELVTLSEKVVPIFSSSGLGYYSVWIADFSSVFKEKPTQTELREYTKSYIEDNNLGVPEVNLTVSFTSLRQAGEDVLISSFEKVLLCDTLSVDFPKLGVSTKAKCIKTEYDVLKNRYNSLQLGDAKPNLAHTIVNQQKAVEKAPTLEIVQEAIDYGAALATGNKGGYVVLYDSNGDGYPDELRILNKSNLEIGRWDVNGINVTVGNFSDVTIKSSNLNNCTTNGTSLTVPGGSISNAHPGYLSLNASNSIGFYANDSIACNATTYVYGPLYAQSDLHVTGEKNRVIATKDFGKRLLSAFETPSPTFSDYGVGEIGDDGLCYIPIDPIFSETIDDFARPVIFLTPYGRGDLHVNEEKTTKDVFVVQGTSGLRFSWETRYKQANSSNERLRIMDNDVKDTTNEHDFTIEANEDLKKNHVDYAQEGYEYYINFERGLTL